MTMDFTPEEQAAQDRIHETAQRLEGTVKRIDEISGYGVQTRKLAKRTAFLAKVASISLALDLALTAVLFILGYRNIHNTNAIHDNQIAACQQANDVRAADIQLWDYVIHISQGKHPTAKQKSIDTQFEKKLNETFAPRNCAQLYNLNDGAHTK